MAAACGVLVSEISLPAHAKAARVNALDEQISSPNLAAEFSNYASRYRDRFAGFVAGILPWQNLTGNLPRSLANR